MVFFDVLKSPASSGVLHKSPLFPNVWDVGDHFGLESKKCFDNEFIMKLMWTTFSPMP
jgi:hypothetical protein